MLAAEACAVAALGVTMRGPHGVHAAAMIRQASEAWRMTAEMWRDVAMRVGELRQAEFNETVVAAERERAAGEALAAAGVVLPAPRPRHLHSVS